MTNRLNSETSPYLIQHAENPVDWFPWGDEALKRAEGEDKPIFLSIGYSACHWCHVMERESFEDPKTAEMMNRDFINIKVDREERPDLDSIYMESVMTMTGHGGWPMSVFLTPKGVPFFGGTYFPPEPRYRMPSFREVLMMVADAFRERRGHIEQTSERLLEALRADERQRGDAVSPALLASAQASLAAGYDDLNGGWGGAPKFPQPMAIEFLLRRYVRTGDSSTLAMATNTLEKMARGGIYDHLGGGFHRYATDAIWLVPHFEKMLYDNSQLARVYLKAWQVTGEPLFRRVVEETLDYVVDEMTNPEGGFYSTLDADSEGEEGKYYVWELSEVREVLGGDAEALMKAYDVSQNGNFEGRSILNRPLDLDVVAHLLDMAPSELDERLAVSKKALFERRARRIRPGLDDKVLTSWNGLMLAAFAAAARAFDNPRLSDGGASKRAIRSFRASHARRPAAADVERWTGVAQRLSGRLFVSSRRAAGAVPGHVRAGVVRRGRRDRRRDDRAVRRSAGRFLRHQRRSRASDHPPEECSGQRHAVGERDGRHRAVPALRIDRRRQIRRGGGEWHEDGLRLRGQAPHRFRAVAQRHGLLPWRPSGGCDSRRSGVT